MKKRVVLTVEVEMEEIGCVAGINLRYEEDLPVEFWEMTAGMIIRKAAESGVREDKVEEAYEFRHGLLGHLGRHGEHRHGDSAFIPWVTEMRYELLWPACEHAFLPSVWQGHERATGFSLGSC